MTPQPDFDPFAPFQWRLAHGMSLELGPSAVVMGIVNVTPDSFSDGGQHLDHKKAVTAAREMFDAGARIIDIGGESSRPGAAPVSAQQEQDRILPVIESLSRETGMLISVDTWRSQTASLAIEAGAHAINDIHGLQRDPGLAGVIAETGAGCIAMHTGRDRRKLADVIADQHLFLSASIEIARQAGVAGDALVLDPGFGFAKDENENLSLLAHLEELHALGHPLLIGTSRKRFVAAASGVSAQDLSRDSMQIRDIGTAATSVVARLKGGAMFRVHDVAMNRAALAMTDAVLAERVRPENR